MSRRIFATLLAMMLAVAVLTRTRPRTSAPAPPAAATNGSASVPSGISNGPAAPPIPSRPASGVPRSGVELFAQDSAPAPEPQPFRISVTEVVVPVTVTDDKGRFVTGMTKDDFQLYDQKVLQNIRFFSAEQGQPVVIGFLLELSSTIKSNWADFREDVQEFARTLLPGDKRYQGYLIGYSSQAELMVDTTYDGFKIADKIGTLKPGGGSALFDAIYVACSKRTQVRGEPLEPHRVIIIMGDGHNNIGEHSLAEVIEMAQRNFVTVYAISTDTPGAPSLERGNLEALARETGGRVEYPLQHAFDGVPGFMSKPTNDGNRAFDNETGGFMGAKLAALAKSIAAIQGEIRGQYILRYQPFTPGDESLVHNLDVVVNLPNSHVNARKSYYAQGR